MAKSQEDPIREGRIHNEAIVGRQWPEEQATGWYYYLDDRIRLPFQARCIAPKGTSPLRKGETVEFVGRIFGVPHWPDPGVPRGDRNA
jgi:hypothetical protein